MLSNTGLNKFCHQRLIPLILHPALEKVLTLPPAKNAEQEVTKPFNEHTSVVNHFLITTFKIFILEKVVNFSARE